MDPARVPVDVVGTSGVPLRSPDRVGSAGPEVLCRSRPTEVVVTLCTCSRVFPPRSVLRRLLPSPISDVL